MYIQCILLGSIQYNVYTQYSIMYDVSPSRIYIHCKLIGEREHRNTLCNMIENLCNVVQCIYPMLPNVYVYCQCNTMYIPNVYWCCPMYIMCPNVYIMCPNVYTVYTLGNKNQHSPQCIPMYILSPNVYRRSPKNVTQCIYPMYINVYIHWVLYIGLHQYTWIYIE